MNLKKKGFAITVLGILVLIFGIYWADNQDSSNFSSLSSSTRDLFEMLPFLVGAFGGVMIAVGIFSIAVELLNSSKPLVVEWGRVIEKNKNGANGVYDMLTVEFANGTRKNLLASKDVILAVGDEGHIGTKGNFIVQFTR